MKAFRFRRHIFIIPSFQFQFMTFLLSMSLVQVFLLWLTTKFFFRQLFKVGEDVHLPPGHIYFQFVSRQEGMFSLFLFIISLTMTLIMLVGSIYLSLKVAGPIYRMRSDLDAMVKGKDPHSIRFRKYDYFQDLSKSFNEFLEKKNNEHD